MTHGAATASRANGKAEAKTKKRRKKEAKEFSRKQAISQASGSAFEVLGEADEDEGDGLEEGDSERNCDSSRDDNG